MAALRAAIHLLGFELQKLKTQKAVAHAERALLLFGFFIACRFAFVLAAMWAWIRDSYPAGYNLSELVH